MNKLIKKNTSFIFLILLIISLIINLIVTYSYTYSLSQIKTKAEAATREINKGVQIFSKFEKGYSSNQKGVSKFSYSNKDFIYQGSGDKKGQVVADEFLNQLGGLKKMKNVETNVETFKDQMKFYPEKASFKLQEKGTIAPFKGKPATESEYLIYQQKIEGIPVYGSQVRIGLKQNSKVTNVNGKLLHGQNVPKSKLSAQDAETIAKKDMMNYADKIKGRTTDPVYKDTSFTTQVIESYQTIYNPYFIGLTNKEDKNYKSQFVELGLIENQNKQEILFTWRYFIDLNSGQILRKSDDIVESIDRLIYYGRLKSNIIRAEGGDPLDSPFGSVNDLYNSFGRIYDFFNEKYGRKSFDNQDIQILAGANDAIYLLFILAGSCKDAAFDPTLKRFYFCKSLVKDEIVAHEYMHGITTDEADLDNLPQTRAINESISDFFSAFYEEENGDATGAWTYGEDIGQVYRQLSNPTAITYPHPRDPTKMVYYADKLSSSNYDCAEKPYSYTNSTILSYGLYLASKGGDFNGQQITGIGTNSVAGFIYRILTEKKLSAQVNFWDFYKAIVEECYLSYPNGINICGNLDKALKAVEIDKQSPNSQYAPQCTSNQAEINETPTLAPTQTITLTVTPTPTPSPVQHNVIPTEKYPLRPTPTATLAPKNIPTNTPIPQVTAVAKYTGLSGCFNYRNCKDNCVPYARKRGEPMSDEWFCSKTNDGQQPDDNITAGYCCSPDKRSGATVPTAIPNPVVPSSNLKNCVWADISYPSGYCSPTGSGVHVYCNDGAWPPDNNNQICPVGSLRCIGKGFPPAGNRNCCSGNKDNNGICN